MKSTGVLMAQLTGGPQDGGWVNAGEAIPWVIHLGSVPMGDGYAAFTRDGPSDRFPARYVFKPLRAAYVYTPKRTT